jgi:phosphoribosylaminoimidazolecarboxamide formyltransferase / IMP cyclohydrolase
MKMKALISVFDKTGLIEFARGLQELGIEFISTGGTAQALQAENLAVTSVAEITNFPEIMGGRVKTLHPLIMGGILGKRDQHQQEANDHQIPWFDLIVCNLYPFAAVIKDKTATFEKIIENIDVGGPTMIRAAAKNHVWTTVVTDPADYPSILTELQTTKTISLATRKKMAAKAFAYTAQYDAIIANYLTPELFPSQLALPLEKVATLRYGENPHQQASVYKYSGLEGGLLNAKQHQGKQLSFNNLFDADAALNCAAEFTQPVCVIVKHANPCGVAAANNIDLAFMNAWLADAKSAFGGIVALNKPCTVAIAEYLQQVFIEVIVAPSYETGALAVLRNKPNLRVLEIENLTNSEKQKYTIKPLANGVLLQTNNDHNLLAAELKCVTQKQPSPELINKLLFAWQIAKYAKSNAIVIAGDTADGAMVTLGIGQGQVSRVDAMELALNKTKNKLNKAVIASDGFFPFRDSIDLLANVGVEAIIQPGGSMRDEEVIAACNEHNIVMVFSGVRNFYH